jgi:hypothetical protein
MLLTLYLFLYEAKWSTLIISVKYLEVHFQQVLPVNDELWNLSLTMHTWSEPG